jgi:hypothetical protein
MRQRAPEQAIEPLLTGVASHAPTLVELNVGVLKY